MFSGQVCYFVTGTIRQESNIRSGKGAVPGQWAAPLLFSCCLDPLLFFGVISAYGRLPGSAGRSNAPPGQSAVRVQVPSLICRAVFFSRVSLTESPALSSNDLRTAP